MTAQRTALVSFALLLFLVAEYVPDGDAIKLLATDVSVPKEPAILILGFIVVMNGLSYSAKYWLEWSTAKKEARQKRMATLFAGKDPEYYPTEGRSVNVSVELKEQLKLDLEMNEAKIKRDRRWSVARDWFFEFWGPVGICCVSLFWALDRYLSAPASW